MVVSKRLKYMLLFILFFMLESIYLNAQTIERVINANKYSIVKITGTNSVIIKMEGYMSASSPGKPILPYRVIQIPLPKNTDLHSLKLTIDSIEEEPIRGQYKIKAARQAISPKKDNNRYLKYNQKGTLFIDKSIYGKDVFSPEKPIKLLSSLSKNVKNNVTSFVQILFSPIQYNPVTKKLKIIKKANISITYETIDRSHMVPGLLPGTELQLKSDYVIITTNKIKNHSTKLQSFVNFKKSQGYSVRIITENEFNRITTTPYPHKRAEKIRQWLRNNYQLLGIEYVLLIGNPEPDDPMYSNDIGDELNDMHYNGDNYIPMKTIWYGLPGEGKNTNPHVFSYVATDWYYADLTGNWDIDGDGFYGESPWVSNIDINRSILPCGLNYDDNFSVRWSKDINLTSAKDVAFELRQWPAARLYIDGTIIFDHFPQTRRESDTRRTVPLSSGQHQIVIEYFKNSNHGHISVRMEDNNGWHYRMNGFKGEYFTDSNMSGNICSQENNETIWKNWETSDYDANNEGVNLEAEVSLGRIPVFENNITVLDDILAKLIREEKNRFASKKILLAMRKMDDTNSTYTLGEAILNDIVAQSNFSAYRIYDMNYTDTNCSDSDCPHIAVAPDAIPCKQANVIDAWNTNNFDIVTWMTHGRWRYANSVLDVKKLNGINKTISVVMAASCNVGNIYLPDCYPRCPSDLSNGNLTDGRISLGYSLLKEGKANAVVSATTWSSYQSGCFENNNSNNNSLDNANFAYQYTKGIISKHSSVGDALKNIKYTPFDMPVDKSLVYRQSLIYNLYGDPSYYPLKERRIIVEPPIRRPIWSPHYDPGMKGSLINSVSTPLKP